MSVEANRLLVGRYYASVGGAGDLADLEIFISPEYVDHNSEPSSPRGPEIVRAHFTALRTTFPDFTLSIEFMLADGDFVATRVRGRGTHNGEWMGIRPSGRVVHLRGINIDRIESGRITEHWGEADTVGMLLQMGVDPFSGRVS